MGYTVFIIEINRSVVLPNVHQNQLKSKNLMRCKRKKSERSKFVVQTLGHFISFQKKKITPLMSLQRFLCPSL